MRKKPRAGDRVRVTFEGVFCEPAFGADFMANVYRLADGRTFTRDDSAIEIIERAGDSVYTLSIRLLAAISERGARANMAREALARVGASDPALPKEGTIEVYGVPVYDAGAEMRRCDHDRRIAERHRPLRAVGIPLHRHACSWCHRDGRPILFPCPDLRDLANGYGVEIGEGS